MALYEKPSLQHLPALFRVGFAARLRSEVADLFVGHDQHSPATAKAKPLAIFTKREDATIFHFNCTASSTSNDNIQTPVVAHLPDSPGLLSYMTLGGTGGTPCTESEPRIVRVTLERSPRTNRILFSVSTVGPSANRRYLSVHQQQRKSCRTVSTCTKFEMFHLEIILASIGHPFSDQSEWGNCQTFVYPAQALIHATLRIGTRFQLQSAAHSTFIARSQQQNTAVCLYDKSDKQLVERLTTFSAVPVKLESMDVCHYQFRDTEGSHVLSIGQNDSIAMKQGNDSVNVRVDTRYWDAIHIGGLMSDDGHTDWLMATKSGHFETRRHCRHFETYRVFFVVQSRRAQLEQLPVSTVVTQAEQCTRAAVRAQIEQACNTSVNNRQPSSASSRPTFNHAAALRGLSSSDERPVSSTPATDRNETKTKRAQPKKKRNNNRPPQQQSSGSPASSSNSTAATSASSAQTSPSVTVTATAAAAAAASSASSSLPRHAANRKAAKRNRKKKRKTNNSNNTSSPANPASANNNNNRNTTNNSSQSNSSRTDPTTSPSSSTSASSSGDESMTSSVTSSSSSLTSSSSSTDTSAPAAATGPPCAACGKPITGPQITALGRKFHPSCLVCGHCRCPVAGGKFRHVNNVPYCEACYAAHVAARCARCDKPILGTVITAMDRTWHHECLTCSICRLPLTQTFWVFANKPNEPRCSRCVTGDEHAGRHHGHGRNQPFVNLPGFSAKNAQPNGSARVPSAGMALGDIGSNPASTGGTGSGGSTRARLMSMPSLSTSTSPFSASK